MDMKRLKMLVPAILLCISCFAVGKDYRVSSPNGRLTATLHTGDMLTLSVALDGKTLLRPSSIGMTLADGTVVGARERVRRQRTQTVELGGESPFHRTRSFSLKAHCMDLRLRHDFGIIVAATNSGVAYRFYTRSKGETTVMNETADYIFGAQRKAWLTYSTNQEDPYAMAFQNIYDVTTLDSAEHRPAFLPVVVDCGQAKVTIMESDVRAYPGMWLTSGGDCLTASFAPYPKAMGYRQHRKQSYVTEREDFIARTTGRRDYPWRVFAVTEDDRQMPTNNLVYALAEPCRIETTDWIRPGKVSWEWWNDWNVRGVTFRGGMNRETYEHYIDFAAKNHLEYVILDEGWYDSNAGDIMHPVEALELPKLISYARERGVGLVLWAVFNVMDDNLEAICDHYAGMGIQGFKVDFLDRNDQTAYEMVERLADCAARHRLILDLHGIYTPTGLERTYPNILNYESVFGMEEVKWGSLKNNHPLYDVTFPYIRMQTGPVDFTPGAMRNGTQHDWVRCYSKPVSQGTRAHQAAMYIVYDSPFTMLCDTPGNYDAEPFYTAFIAGLPTVFDRTEIIDGKMGEYIVTLRQKGGIYYLGGLTNWQQRHITITTDFLPAGLYKATIVRDGINADKNAEDYMLEQQELSAGEPLKLHMAPGGGFAIVIGPQTR